MANRKSGTTTNNRSKGIKNDYGMGSQKEPAKYWKGVSVLMGSQLEELTKTNQQRQSEWNSRWMQFYTDMANYVLETMKGEQLAQAQQIANLLNSFGNKIAIALNKSANSGNGSIRSIQETWNEHMTKIGHELTKTMSNPNSSSNSSEIYRMWVEFSVEQVQNMTELMGKTSSGAIEMLDTWKKFNGDISDMVKDITQQDGKVYEELSKKISKASAAVNEDIMKVLDEQGDSRPWMQGIRPTFFTDMTRFMDVTNSGKGLDYESITKMYSDTANRMMKSFNLPLNLPYSSGASANEVVNQNKETEKPRKKNGYA